MIEKTAQVRILHGTIFLFQFLFSYVIYIIYVMQNKSSASWIKVLYVLYNKWILKYLMIGILYTIL